jgi:hypothetical protein
MSDHKSLGEHQALQKYPQGNIRFSSIMSQSTHASDTIHKSLISKKNKPSLLIFQD